MTEASLPTQLIRLWLNISHRRRREFGLLLIVMVLASFAEMISIGSVLPFLGVLTSPERVFLYPALQPLIQFLGLVKPDQLLLPITITFGAAAIVAAGVRLFLLLASTRLSFAIGAEISYNIYRRTLYQPYAVHSTRNSSEIVNSISTKSNIVIYNIIVPILTIISSGVIIFIIFMALLAIDPVIALIAIAGLSLIYFGFIKLTRNKLVVNGQLIAHESTHLVKALQEGLGGIRDVIIDNTQAYCCEIYRAADLPLRRAQGDNLFIGQSPRYGMEALGILIITVLAYTLSQSENGIANAIPILGALALSAQRLLPILQQSYGGWSAIRGAQASLKDILALLDQPLPCHTDPLNAIVLPFDRSISLRRVAFRYSPETQYVLQKINLSIAKGERVGFIGTTGSGKSTLIDIIMGLLLPTYGQLEVDGHAITRENASAWQRHIAHVPQSIFLADCSVEENIAFGVPKDQIDHQRVVQAAQQAQMADSIESWPQKYQTKVGERGIRLSGGQRQRIGIARALYKKADVIIFDEATSALDNETEQAVMQSIERLSDDLTILIIAHRVTTLRSCTQIVKIHNGTIKHIVGYENIETTKL